MPEVAFGLLANTKVISTTDLVEELEKAADGEDWSWVLWELNRSYFGILTGSLRFKGRIVQIDDIDVISLGEAVESSEDSRAKWIMPAKSSTGSVHELAHRKINNFISAVYGSKVREEEDIAPEKPKDRVLAPISSRRKFTGVVPSGHPSPAAKKTEGSESEPQSRQNSAPAAAGSIARTSRRGN